MLGPNSTTKYLPGPGGELLPVRPRLGITSESMEPLLNLDEAAEMIGRTHWTLRRDVKAGTLKSVRIGRRIMIEASEIRRLIEAGRK